MKINYRYVWLNLITGKFSNSWDENQHKKLKMDKIIKRKPALLEGYKLIKYACLNDKEFNFLIK